MTFRKLFMLAGIGGLVYAHKKRGGQMTLESFKQSGRELLDTAKNRAANLRSQAETRIHDVAGRVADQTNVQSGVGSNIDQGGTFGDDVTGYGSSGYGYRR
jgi:hypothetical protein